MFLTHGAAAGAAVLTAGAARPLGMPPSMKAPGVPRARGERSPHSRGGADTERRSAVDGTAAKI
jgi:hypothetical protein